MKIDQAQLDKVEVKLNNQNAVLAVLGSAFWTIPFIVAWYFVYLYNPQFSPVMLLLNGFLVGLAVRIHGKGLTGIFSLIAILVHTSIVLVAFSLNIVLAGTTWAFLLFGLYVAGAIAAKKIARIEVPFEEHRAYSYLTSPEAHESNKKLKNTWFITLPVLLLTIALTAYFSLVSLTLFSEYQAQSREQQRSLMQQEYRHNKEIDIMPAALEKRSSHDILLYAYGYHSGLLFNKRGMRNEVFPRSKYKALALLKYLVESRDNARAKYILGLLMADAKGRSLIKAAAEQKDQYARIHSAVHFGCYSNEDLAIELLSKLRDLSSEEYIKEEINSMLYLGISDTCQDFEEPEFALSYAINYSENSSE